MNYLVVGYGNIGRRRAALLAGRCVATVDPVASDASVRSVDDVAAGRYDAVVLATPNDVKPQYLRRFLAAGKSVLVEKPLLVEDRAEIQALTAGARDGAIWYTSYNCRFEPLLVRLKQRLDEGAVGTVDRIRMVYGNGTVRHWVGTWREAGPGGVIEDLGCHLLDLCAWLRGTAGAGYVLWDARRVESATWDYALFGSSDRRVVMEVGTVFWKNTFAVEVHGEAGSLHLVGLGKWGPVTLTHHARAWPSGVPRTTQESVPAGDGTWAADLAEFERRVAHGVSSAENDAHVAEALAALLAQAAAPALAGVS